MNRILVLIITFSFLISCSSKKGINYLDESKDDLSRESLSRKKILKESNQYATTLLAKCYKDPSYKIKENSRQKLDKLKNSFSYWSAVGSCYLHRGNSQKALFFYKVSLSKVKTKAQKAIYLNNIGVYYTKVGRLNLAINQFYESISKNKRYKTPHMNLAMIYAQFGLNKKARTQLSHFKGSSDPHILYINKVVSSSKDIIGFLPNYLTDEEKKQTISKLNKE